MGDYYKPRANDENIIDNLKNCFGFDDFNMNSFWATEANDDMSDLLQLVFILDEEHPESNGLQTDIEHCQDEISDYFRYVW